MVAILTFLLAYNIGLHFECSVGDTYGTDGYYACMYDADGGPEDPINDNAGIARTGE